MSGEVEERCEFHQWRSGIGWFGLCSLQGWPYTQCDTCGMLPYAGKTDVPIYITCNIMKFEVDHLPGLSVRNLMNDTCIHFCKLVVWLATLRSGFFFQAFCSCASSIVLVLQLFFSGFPFMYLHGTWRQFVPLKYWSTTQYDLSQESGRPPFVVLQNSVRCV
jgi:hypothetical protein